MPLSATKKGDRLFVVLTEGQDQEMSSGMGAS
jgi:hypothetical protein